MKIANLIFPHQLFAQTPLVDNGQDCYLVEEFLFFRHYPFHQQKIAFHRASMRAYADYLRENGSTVHYVEAIEDRSDVRQLLAELARAGVEHIHYVDPTDNWLSRRIRQSAAKHQLERHVHDSPLFFNRPEDLSDFFRPDKKKFFQTKFYIQQRKGRDILLVGDEAPLGGKWSFDAENRKKYPKKKVPPSVEYPAADEYWEEALSYVRQHFSEHYGQLVEQPRYPYQFATAEAWLEQFLERRFHEFGPYEDAIVAEEDVLNHSLLTPMINVGLLSPKYVVDRALDFAADREVPLNSTEGFVRQLIGWREFIRGIYEVKGSYERTRNYWGFERKIPPSFYDGTTGIEPVDRTIRRVLKTGYCHHIERLMVLGNFMLLCEFDPDEVYRWFMELFIDAYDWVMVPNVYGMSQFADGGLMSTKPYISGSNYLLKMSDYKKGPWQAVWDGLFWRFMHVQRDFFLKNPRLGMLVRTFDKMSEEMQQTHLDNAEAFLAKLDQSICEMV